MAALLKIVDEHFGPTGTDRRPAIELKLVSERITPREIIERRVELEVETLNNRKLAHAAGQLRSRSFLIDVEVTSPEAVLNAGLGTGRKLVLARVEREAARAFQAFEKQRFIMLLDDKQIEGLDDEVTVMAESQIVFLYLMPLKGG
ncbi:hypothetical protein [Phenylobacterium sp.]|uniref:hypothetical protein n=1 Tax=Phenylobacterium sp. TaxID=1871053 RepID=UPI00286BD9E7|nr:hypothetical protein [Phenylobacterium sp.]